MVVPVALVFPFVRFPVVLVGLVVLVILVVPVVSVLQFFQLPVPGCPGR